MATLGNSYPGIGRCIYCGRNDGPLTREHIIPYALGGNLVIQQASCEACSTVTSAVERQCARGFFSDLRAHLNLSSRKKKERPTELPYIAVTPKGEQRFLVPIVNHPYRFKTLMLEEATLLQGRAPSQETHARVVTINFQQDYKRRLAIQQHSQHVEEVVFDYLALAGMVAKIGHAAAVAIAGADAFEPALIGVILGTEAYAHYVGSAEETLGKQSPPEQLHRLRVFTISIGGVWYVVCDVQLFSFLGAPAYRVVAGRQLKSLPHLASYVPPEGAASFDASHQ
ncbi:hypothetical protein C1O66_07090 [Paucibacter aquatile]|uniref:HNH endonuclease 5 domain-containing protein n=1 Tax=Kinneretia aquatilis TaxID=2070761 RepID=A0A2N8KV19_9BURK|nr:HNH endonuclease [Paucibacter aquatile]PND37318.1 hypothetical protein C1O66_07090 [Paucibacter aquatile]